MQVQPTGTQNRIAEPQSTKRKTSERRRFGDRRRKNIPIRFSDRRSNRDRRDATRAKTLASSPKTTAQEGSKRYDEDSSVGQNIDLRV